MRPLNVHSVPEHAQPDDLEGSTAVVIDVLRATTTIVTALSAGARAVIPCLTIGDALAAAAALPRESVILGGERGGLPIDGFDLGNSPAEYTRERVDGKTVVLTTTNGTRALLHCREADTVLAGAFANISALVAELAECPRVEIVCAGTDGRVTDEDLLLAGAIVDRLAESRDWQLNAAAEATLRGWRATCGNNLTRAERTERIVAAMSAAPGGRNLIEIGMAADIELSAQRDTANVVPRYDVSTGEIVA
jgi:2-phosphosulfolactate phosphatase